MKELLKKFQAIGNIVFLIAFVIAIIWMKIDYEKKINNLAENFDKELQGIQYSIIDSNERTALSIKDVNEQIDIVGTNITTLNDFVQNKLK